MSSQSTKTCPYCAETIFAAAIKCKHCSSDLVAATEPAVIASPWFYLARALTGIAAGLLILLWAAHVIFDVFSSSVGANADTTPDAMISPTLTTNSSRTSSPHRTLRSPVSGGPSFDCIKADSRSERLICSDAELSDRDKSLAREYRDALRFTQDPAALKQQQKNALNWRQANCTDKTCVLQWYIDRDRDLFVTLKDVPKDSRPCAPLYDESTGQAQERFERIVDSFARRHGETVEDFYRHIGSADPSRSFSFALAMENCGGSIADALQTLQATADSLGNR